MKKPTRMLLRRTVLANFAGAKLAASMPANLQYDDDQLAQLAYRLLTRHADHEITKVDDARSFNDIGITALEKRLLKSDSNAVLEALHAPGRISIGEINAISKVAPFVALFVSKG